MNIGFVSTRFAGTDGVSLETEKWAHVLEHHMGHECFYFAGECNRPPERSYVVPEAHFQHPDILAITSDLFDDYQRSSDTSGRVHFLRRVLKEHLYRFLKRFDLHMLIVENALSIPMNIPLGLALTEVITETSIPTIAHHHDFAWERSRFKVSAAADYQYGAFPPMVPSIQHVVINSYAARQLALRTGLTSLIVPNVMDFDTPPPAPDAFSRSLRPQLGIPGDHSLILQPTRVVPRKHIESAIELVRRLEMPACLLISHQSGDEGQAYQQYLQELAELLDVRVLFAAEHFGEERRTMPDGSKRFSLHDAYLECSLVTYPSRVEGFGNAFLEAVYYKRPIVISTYDIFRTDILPKGFRVIGFNDFITPQAVEEARRALRDPGWVAEMTEHNFALGKRFYSYRRLERSLHYLLCDALGADGLA